MVGDILQDIWQVECQLEQKKQELNEIYKKINDISDAIVEVRQKQEKIVVSIEKRKRRLSLVVDIRKISKSAERYYETMSDTLSGTGKENVSASLQMILNTLFSVKQNYEDSVTRVQGEIDCLSNRISILQKNDELEEKRSYEHR